MSLNPFCRFTRRFLTAAFFLAALQGCADIHSRDADDIAAAGALQSEDITTGPFTLTTYSRIRDINLPITVYIEGDIQGFWPQTDPGTDPMPDDWLGLRLAAEDPSPNVAYIARPCQFMADNPECSTEAWSHGKYAEQIVTAMNRAVDHFAVPFTHPRVNLVGYSGGGAIAAIIATRRKDVVSLRTIAGNMDPAAASRYHAADADDDFVDPMLIAYRLKLLPQEHYVGERDTTVPPFITANFIKAIGPSYCVRLTYIPMATHKTGWEQAWKTRAANIPTCNLLSDFK